MRSNVRGRVRNTALPKGQGLLPVYEAVINSVEAIEDLGLKPSEGQITINITRSPQLAMADPVSNEPLSIGPISEICVTDNGIGFSEENYQSFNVADSQYKEQRGGKGVGRFIWLKAFRAVKIDSTFAYDNGMAQRTFEFSVATDDGVTDHKLDLQSNVSQRRTSVLLIGFRDEYEASVPRNTRTIAQRIIEHCLEFFVLGRMPVVWLYDSQEEEPININQMYDELVANTSTEPIRIGSNDFRLRHFYLLAHAGLHHHVSFSANGRVVQTMKLDEKRIPNLQDRLPSKRDDEQLVYAAYVSSDYLDQRVNQQRTGFDTPPEGGFVAPDDMVWSDIEEGVLSAISQQLMQFTETARTEKEKRIREYVNAQAPQYRHILKRHPEQLDMIPSGLSDRQLEARLHEIHLNIEIKLHQKAEELIASGVTTVSGVPYHEQLEQFSEFWGEWNDVGKANLARYIVHRKLMLNVLEEALKAQGGRRYAREDVIHEVVFPLRTTSDDIGYDQHNLWILDEKLAYHRYLASDIPLRRVEELNSDSISRPDLLIFFDRAIAVVDDEFPYNSGVVIFEFKRPMRDDYTAEDNPIQQVLGYVREIKGGNLKDRDGRQFRVQPSTPFYCYIVCDITRRLIEQAENAGYTRTPDGRGFFGYNPSLGAYVEVIDFDKLVDDAKKRNRVLFEALKLPERLIPPKSF